MGGVGPLTTSALFCFFMDPILSSEPGAPYFKTRGVVLSVDDLTSLPTQWPHWAEESQLTTVSTHVTPSSVQSFLKTKEGHLFLDSCSDLGLHVEHELHAMSELLPRSLFSKKPEFFRMNEKGKRSPDANLCIHSEEAVQLVCQNACLLAQALPSTTGRTFFWLDDGSPMCQCPSCRGYSDSDQALILENAMLSSLREVDAGITLAHLAYAHTLMAPSQVKPREGIFLEFAPIHRSWEAPISQREIVGRGKRHGDTLDYLDANLDIFPRETAQVLEYWLDVSLHSQWKRPARKLPWNREVFLADLETYASRGVRHITSFGVYVDEEYVNRFGPLYFLKEYGEGLLSYNVVHEDL